MASKNPNYILGTDAKAVQNLEDQQNRIAGKSFEQLQKAGLKKGMVIWDVGCGSGTMTEYLASQVGESGHVYALDISKELLDVAKERIKKANLTNVTFILGDIKTLDNSNIPKADIAFSRLVLMHMPNTQLALKKMHDLLKSGGVISLQESTMSTVHLSFSNANIEDFYKTMIAFGNSRGGDFDLGRKLPALCSELEFAKVEHYISQHILNASDSKKAMLGRLDEMRDKLLEAQLVSNERIMVWESTIINLPNDDSFNLTSAEQTHILAWKK
jgi:ubiquinone/menaquinone biosynthesis C-methylase UbiE